MIFVFGEGAWHKWRDVSPIFSAASKHKAI